MLKYLYNKVVFQEIPNEVSLGLSISGCTIHCQGCNQRELWEDKGINLTIGEINRLLIEQKGVTCLLLLGGERDIDALTEIFQYFHQKIKTAWYCGLDMVPKDKLGILQYLDFCKLGHFDSELGGLASSTTNQRLFQYNRMFSEVTPPLGVGWRDITFKLQRHENKG